jgi:hypothetical protein
MKHLIITILVITHAFISKAQNYPVSISTQVIPPYTTYLTDYGDKLRVILLQRDLTQPSYNISIQMTIELNGSLILRTAPHYHPQPITLTPGVPLIISGTALTDYFLSENLTFTGTYPRETYERTHSLPEGAYRITFTAYDYRRPTLQVSTPIPSVFFLRKTDPPILNLPVCGSRVDKRDPQFLTFNWSNRNTAPQNTAYIFSLFEIKPAGANPDYIIRSTRPLYTTTTDNTTILYGPAEPTLTDTMQYAWIVQAIDKDGKDSYSNQGISQTCTFTYKGINPFEQYNIPTPTLSGTAKNERQINYHWPSASDHINTYHLQYRASARDSITFNWQSVSINADTAFTLNSLEPGRTYEARLQFQVGDAYSPFSETVMITTPSLPIVACGTAAQLTISDNTHLQPSLLPGHILRIGFYDVLLTDVQGSNGTFTGNGRVITLGFGFGLQMTFRNITVNTDLVVIKGDMQAVTNGINKFVKDKLDEQHGGNDMGQVKTGDLVADITTYLQLLTKEAIVADSSSHTITLYDTPTAQVETHHYTKLPLLIEDAAGNIYQVNDHGDVHFAGKRDVMLAASFSRELDLSAGQVTFSPGSDNQYAFDPRYDTLGPYIVPAKAILPATRETLLAQRPDTTTITFVNGKGVKFPATCEGSTCRVTITGGPAADAQEVYALTPAGKTIGKVLVPSYPSLNKSLILIPIGSNISIPEKSVTTTLQQVYGRIGITYALSIDNSFATNKTWDLNQDGLLQDSKSAVLSNGFTGEERAMQKAYRKSHHIDDNAIYLFVINEAAMASADLLGKMPRQSQFGFIFTRGATANDISRSIAHEIGHGDYTLEHISNAPDNLMAAGLVLTKHQWDIVHDPGSVWGLFEDDAASELTKGLSLYKCLQKEAQAACDQPMYYTPDSMVIKLPEGALPTSVFYQDFSTRHPAMPGSLQAFQYGGREYNAIYFANTGQFKGYSYDKSDTASFIYGRAKQPGDIVNNIGFGKEVYSCEVTINGIPFKNDGCLCQDNLYTAQYNRLMREVIGADQPAVQEEIAAVCKTILSMPADVLATNNELFECYYNKPDLYYLDWNNVSATITFAQLQRIHTQLKTLDSSIMQLRDCEFATGNDLVTFINEHFVIAGTKTSYLTGAQFSALSPAQRACLIAKLLNGDYSQRWRTGSAGFGGQNIMLEILRGCKSTAELYTVIQILRHDNLLYTLFGDTFDYLYVSDGIFTALCNAITVAWLNGEKPGLDHALIQNLILNKQWLVFDNGYLTSMNREAFNDKQQRMSFDVKDGAGAYFKYLTNVVAPGAGQLFKDYAKATPFKGSFAPLDYLVVIPSRDIRAFGTTLEQGIPYILPAISVYALFKMDTKAAVEISADLVLNTALCSIGMEGMAAAGGMQATMEMINVGLTTFMAYANTAPEIAEDNPALVRYTNYLAMAYMVGTLTTGTIKSIRNTPIAVPAEMIASRYADDALEISHRAILLEGEELSIIKSLGDEQVHIVVQQVGNEYFVFNNGIRYSLKHHSLARYLDGVGIPSNKEIILLSCKDFNSAQHLSDVIGRPVIASDKWVMVYENGAVLSGDDFLKLSPGGSSYETVKFGKQYAPAGDAIILGDQDYEGLGTMIFNNLTVRAEKSRDRIFTFTKSSITQIVKTGKEIGIPDAEIEDIIYNGCRNDKRFSEPSLIDQIKFWDEVRKRGYPNLFNSLSEFEEFGNLLKGLAREWGLPEEIYVQGSALRMRDVAEIGDLDIAIRVGKEEFEELVNRFKGLVKIESVLRAFGKNGIIRGYNLYNDEENFYKLFIDRYNQKYGLSMSDKMKISKIQISIIERGSKFDISPFLKIN